MGAFSSIIYVGNPTVTLPASAGIAACLLYGRRWKLAIWWCALFCAGLGLVVGSKILFIGWGGEWRPLAFKAVSGHAMLTSSIIPTASYLLLQPFSRALRVIGVVSAMLFSMLVSVFLVDLDFHTTSESIAGFMTGVTVSLTFIRRASAAPATLSYFHALGGGTLAFAAALAVQPATCDYLLTGAALAISGHEWPYSFSTGTQVHYIPQASKR